MVESWASFSNLLCTHIQYTYVYILSIFFKKTCCSVCHVYYIEWLSWLSWLELWWLPLSLACFFCKKFVFEDCPVEVAFLFLLIPSFWTWFEQPAAVDCQHMGQSPLQCRWVRVTMLPGWLDKTTWQNWAKDRRMLLNPLPWDDDLSCQIFDDWNILEPQ